MARVHLPSHLARSAGGSEVIEVDAPRVQDLLQALSMRFPDLAGRLEQLAVAIDGEIYTDAPYQPLAQESEVYFVPRVAGGGSA